MVKWLEESWMLIVSQSMPLPALLHIEGGNVLASGDDYGLIRLWDLRVANRGKKHAILMEFAEDEVFHIQKVTLSHDKKFLASCTLDNMVKIIDVSTSGLGRKNKRKL